MEPSPDVLILGGGVIGLTCAHFLAEAGLKVEVIDRQQMGREASWAGAGIVPPGNFDRAGSPLDRLRAFSVSRFPAFTTMLEETTGQPTGYRICGGIEFLDAESEYAVGLWNSEGIEYERIDAERSKSLEPQLAPSSNGYLLPGMAQIRNPWFMRSLTMACQRIGVRMLPETPAEGWAFDSRGRIDGVALKQGGTLRARTYLLAAGSWAEPWLRSLGLSAGVQPVRGQMLLYRTETPLLRRIVIDGKRYFVPRSDGRLLVGATEEFDAGFVKDTTAEGIASLRTFAESRVPTLKQVELETAWAGLRPGSADGFPTIGPLPGHSNAFAAVGHFRAGIQLSQGTGHLIRDLVLGRTAALDPAPFAPGRVLNLPPRTAFRS
jgi:glycine oxidase